ncbi:PilN domain-containing protein [candidate division CSSED10-310 bacterium]|uniref:PilN domain-containing protein n=1 Tax=candidate division CSSED10-310 bacterium TaxID=2855610 RepID=A0ABV6Z2C5_UNCC1
MIKINLLPTEGPGPSKVYVELIAGLIVLVVAVIAIGAYWNYLNGIIDNRNEEIRVKEEQVRKLQNIIDAVKKFEKEKQILEKKINTIKNLRENQKGPVSLLDTLSKNVPDNVWYTKLGRKGNKITLNGAALSMMSIGDLIQNLSEPGGLFKKIQLKKTQMNKLKGREIYVFQMDLMYEEPKKKQKKGQGGQPGQGGP